MFFQVNELNSPFPDTAMAVEFCTSEVDGFDTAILMPSPLSSSELISCKPKRPDLLRTGF